MLVFCILKEVSPEVYKPLAPKNLDLPWGQGWKRIGNRYRGQISCKRLLKLDFKEKTQFEEANCKDGKEILETVSNPFTKSQLKVVIQRM